MSWLKFLAPANMYCTARGTREQWGLMAETLRITEGESMLCARESRRADIQGGNARRVPSANITIKFCCIFERSIQIRHLTRVPTRDVAVRRLGRAAAVDPTIHGRVDIAVGYCRQARSEIRRDQQRDGGPGAPGHGAQIAVVRSTRQPPVADASAPRKCKGCPEV